MSFCFMFWHKWKYLSPGKQPNGKPNAYNVFKCENCQALKEELKEHGVV